MLPMGQQGRKSCSRAAFNVLNPHGPTEQQTLVFQAGPLFSLLYVSVILCGSVFPKDRLSDLA